MTGCRACHECDILAAMSPRYSIPYQTVSGLIWAVLRRQERSFRADACTCIGRLNPPLQTEGRSHIPAQGPALLTVNHYSQTGFQAWWIPLAISSAVPVEVHWTMTAAWTFTDRPWARPLTPLTRWLFRRLAQVYRFTTMPPMPPHPSEVEARARAVRRVLEYARRAPRPLIGLSPEGKDWPGGVLGQPPPGAGRFIGHLAQWCPDIVPVGLYQEGDDLCLRFGPPYRLELFPAKTMDREISQQVMRAIARQLPAHLRGEFG